jgi:cephalosporin hydroxylase
MAPTVEVEDANGNRKRLNIYSDEGFLALTELWIRSGWERKFTYDVTWLGIPVIQLPEDMLMLQELIYKVRPDVVVECGTAHGGTALFCASVLELLEKGRVLSIDVEIRKYNRLAMMSHPLSHRLTLVEGSSVEEATLDRVKALLHPGERVMVLLDSNHSKDHVSKELSIYAPLVTLGSYIVVYDGVMQLLLDAPHGSPAWANDNPAVAVRGFLAGHPEFEADPYYNRLTATYCPGGYLKRKRPEGTEPNAR